MQAQALQALDCKAPDPLRGYDDPTRPLVSCNQDGTEKYVLGPSFLEGTQIATAQASQNTQGAGWIIDVTFKSAGSAIWGDSFTPVGRTTITGQWACNTHCRLTEPRSMLAKPPRPR